MLSHSFLGMISSVMISILDVSEYCILEQQYKYKLVDRKYQKVDEEVDLSAKNNFSSSYPDFLLENCQDEDAASDLSFLKVESQLWCQSMEKDSGTAEISELEKAYTYFCEASFDQNTWVLENMEADKLQDTHGRSLELSTPARDVFQNGHHSFGIENLSTSGNSSNPFRCCLGANDCEDEMILASNNVTGVSTLLESISNSNKFTVGKSNGDSPLYVEDVRDSRISSVSKTGHKLLNLKALESTLVTCKRLRKTPRKYIEETSKVSSRCNERLKFPSIVTRDRFSATAVDRNCLKETKSSQRRDAGIQRPRNWRQLDGFLGGVATCFDHGVINKKESSGAKGVETLSSNSQGYITNGVVGATEEKKIKIRRNQQRAWTLAEVMTLIEGVSRLGVGKWAGIKKQFFPNSAFRTPVHLKDKWRNLVRTSTLMLHYQWQIDPHKECMNAKIPHAVLQRIRELSVTQPCPSNSKSKTSVSSNAANLHYYR